MHKHVEILIGRLATDPKLRGRFGADPVAVLAELVEQGLELTNVERAALAALDPQALATFAGALDGRLRRASAPPPPSGISHSPTPPNQENPVNAPDPNPRRRRPPSLVPGLGALVLAALALGGAPAGADSDWTWTVTPYAWATDVGAEVVVDDRRLVDADVAASDLVDDLDTTFQLRVEAQRGEHGVVVDVFDVVLSAPYHRVALPDGAPSGSLLGQQVGMTILELGGSYDPGGDRQGFAVLYGARVLDQRVELAVLELATGAERTHRANDTLVDAVVGVRFARQLSRRFNYLGRADVSAGGTELTWSASASLGYALGETGRYALTVGYRYLEVDFDTEEAIDLDMTLAGFLTGLRITF